MMKIKFEGLCPHCKGKIELIKELPAEAIEAIRNAPEQVLQPPEGEVMAEVGVEQGQASLIDMDWLKESLRKVKWSESTCISWLRGKANYQGLAFTGRLESIVAQMNKEQAAFLVKEIETRLEMA